MKSTTKSCSTYLSQKRPQFLHTVKRMLCPLDLSPVPEYCVHSVFTGYRHSMQMAMLDGSTCGRRVRGSCVVGLYNRAMRRPLVVVLGLSVNHGGSYRREAAAAVLRCMAAWAACDCKSQGGSDGSIYIWCGKGRCQSMAKAWT